MMYMADRLIRCGHDFNCYDLTLNKGQLLLLDFPHMQKFPELTFITTNNITLIQTGMRNLIAHYYLLIINDTIIHKQINLL